MREHLFPGVDSRLLLLGILHGRQIVGSLCLLLIAVRIKGRDNERKYHNDNNHHKAYHSHFIFCQTAHTVFPEAHALPHDNLALLFLLGCRQEILGIKF